MALRNTSASATSGRPGAGRRAGPRQKAGGAPLSFVDAETSRRRRLHYDFRLELDGVLRAGRSPRGRASIPARSGSPSMSRTTRSTMAASRASSRRASMAAARSCCGTAAPGARWSPIPQAAYAKGSLKFRLDGEKLHGNWALVRMGGARRRTGARELAADQGARRRGAARQRRRAGRRQPAQRRDRAARWTAIAADARPGLGLDTRRDRPATRRRAAPTAAARRRREAGAARSRRRRSWRPRRTQPPAGEEWLHEIKHDGYRLLARIERGKVRLVTRNGLDWTGEVPGAGGRPGRAAGSTPR